MTVARDGSFAHWTIKGCAARSLAIFANSTDPADVSLLTEGALAAIGRLLDGGESVLWVCCKT